MPTVCEVRAARIKHIEELAVTSFAEHRIEQPLNVGLFRYWECGQAHSSVYAFRIITTPGRLIVVGDIGDLIVERVPDMIPWARSSIKDISYFAQKVPQAIPTREYDPDVARAWLEEIKAERAEEIGSIKIDTSLASLIQNLEEHAADYMDEIGNDEGVFQRLVYESGIVDGCDFPDFSNWNCNFLWCREAVKWLLTNLQESPDPVTKGVTEHS